MIEFLRNEGYCDEEITLLMNKYNMLPMAAPPPPPPPPLPHHPSAPILAPQFGAWRYQLRLTGHGLYLK